MCSRLKLMKAVKRDNIPTPFRELEKTKAALVQERRSIAGRVPPYHGAMSDHSEAPVAPVDAYEPPTTWQSSLRCEPRTSGYTETNARMEDLVKDVPGYLGMDHAQTPGGLGITVGYFRDSDALTSGAVTPSTERRKGAGKPSGTRATRCMWREWSGVTVSRERRSNRARQQADQPKGKGSLTRH